jgi:hypothetical protein
MLRAAGTATRANGDAPLDAVLRAVRGTQPGEPGLDRLVCRVLRSALGQRQARPPTAGELSVLQAEGQLALICPPAHRELEGLTPS